MTSQAITQPHGVNVVGASVLFVEPDHARLEFYMLGAEAKGGAALQAARTAASGVSQFLQRLGVAEADRKMGRPTLQDIGGNWVARIGFNVLLRDLELVDNVMTGVAESGAREVAVVFKATGLADAQAEAQQSAVLSAFKRANLLAEAAGIKLGRVLHIEDVDPAELSEATDLVGEEYHPGGTHNPTAIVVRAAVRVSLSIKGGGSPEVTGQFAAFG